MKIVARTFAGLIVALAALTPAQAASLSAGLAAYEHQNYNAAAAILRPLAIAGDPRAQSYVGYMYATGRGFPQNYNVAAYWYFRAANQGETTAQYQLGLLYDKATACSRITSRRTCGSISRPRTRRRRAAISPRGCAMPSRPR